MATTVADADVLIHADVSELPKEIAKKVGSIVKSIKETVKIDGDTSGLDKSVEKAQRSIADVTSRRREPVKIPVELDLDRDKAERSLFTRIGNVAQEVSQGFVGVLGLATGSLGSFQSAIASGLPAIATMGSLLALLPIALGAIVQLLSALLPLVLVFPGALLAIGAVAGVAALGLKGFTEALSGDEEAMRRLSPAARELAQTLIGLKPAFDGIRQAVQERLFQGLAAPIEQLVTSTLPGFRTALESISTSLNTGIREGLAVLNSEAGQIQLQKIFESTATAVDALFTAIGPLTNALLSLGAVGARLFAKIAPGLASQITKISDGISRLAESGSFDRAFSTALDVAKSLVGVIKEIGGVIKTISAGIGEGLTSILGDASTAERLNSVKNFFADLQRVLQNPTIKEGLNTIGVLFGIVIKVLGALILVQGAALLGFVFLIGAISQAVQFLAELPGKALDALQGLGVALGEAFLRAFNFVRNIVIEQINNIRGLFFSIIGAVVGALSELGGRLFAVFAGAFETARSAVAFGVSSIAQFVSSIPGRILGAIGNVGSLLFSAGQQIVQGLINGINSRLGALRSAAASIAGAIRSHLPFSPAKEGPLSGRGAPEISGASIAKLIAKGLLSETKVLTNAAARTVDALSGAQLASSLRAPTLDLAGQTSTRLSPSPQRFASGATTSTVNKNFSPQITVNSSTADPEAVANRVLRRLSWTGGF